MVSLPRIITVDPTGAIARIVRSAVDLLDRPTSITDVPNGEQALEEMELGQYVMLITAWELDGDIQGPELALRTKQIAQETAVMILADVDNPAELDEETLAESPFVYLSRPVDIHQFLRVLIAGLDGGDIRGAMKAPAGAAPAAVNMGAVPPVDINASQSIIDQLLTDLGAMAIIFSSRAGEVLLERGAVGYLDRELLTSAMLPVVHATVNIKDIVGGQATSLQFYDGENYDVFVLSVGLHHFMCLVFEGEGGARQFGAVNRFGRRAAEDLIALLGANAWLVERAPVVEEERSRKKKKKARDTQEEEKVSLVKAEFDTSPIPEPEPESVIQPLDPIPELDIDGLFAQMTQIAEEDAEEMFDLDKLEELASEDRKRGEIDWSQATELGIFSSTDQE